MKRVDDLYWTWIYNEEIKFSDHITGKYLFFCDDKEKLLLLGEEILSEHGLCHGKVSNASREEGKGFDYVLCVYDTEPKLKDVLFKEYGSREEVSYRYWKSDEDTRKGIYSEKFRTKND